MRQLKIAALHVQAGLATVLALIVVNTAAWAETRLAVLDGFQENPSVATSAVGVFVANIADDEQQIEVLLIYSPLEGGTVTAAHIHFARDRVNGGIVIHLCGTGGTEPCPTPTGQVAATVTAADVVDLPGQGIAAGDLATIISAMRRGATYANVHSTDFPGGEIRGQIR